MVLLRARATMVALIFLQVSCANESLDRIPRADNDLGELAPVQVCQLADTSFTTARLDEDIDWLLLWGESVNRQTNAALIVTWPTDNTGEHYYAYGFDVNGRQIFDDILDHDLLLNSEHRALWFDPGDGRQFCQEQQE